MKTAKEIIEKIEGEIARGLSESIERKLVSILLWIDNRGSTENPYSWNDKKKRGDVI